MIILITSYMIPGGGTCQGPAFWAYIQSQRWLWSRSRADPTSGFWKKKHDDKQDEYDDDDDVDEPFAVLLDRIFKGKGDAAQQYHKHDEAVKERTSHKPMQVDSNPETKVSSFILKIDI